MGWFDKIAARIASELDEAGLDGDARAQLELARAYFDRGDLDEAASRLAPLLSAQPRNTAIVHLAGEIEQAHGNWEAAVTYFGRAVDSDASFAQAWLSLAYALVPLGRYEPALEASRRATQLFENFLDPDTRRRCLALSHVLRGRVALAQERFEVARREFELAMNLGVEDQTVAADHGRALVKLDPEEGARWLRHAAHSPGASVPLVLEAADAQADPAVGADLLTTFAATHSQLGDADHTVLQARAALMLARAKQIESAQAIISGFGAPGSHASSALIYHDLAHTNAELENFSAALAWAKAALEPILAPEVELKWSLGTCESGALHEFAHRFANSASATLVNAALTLPPSFDAVAALVQQAPTNAARVHWAKLLAPPPPDDDAALSLLQNLTQIITPLPPSGALASALARAREALSRPLVVALLGEFNAGKSSLVNALVETPLAPVGIKPTTATINVFRHGMGGAHVVYRNGKMRRLQTAQVQPFLSTLAQEDAETIEAVDIFLPHAPLQAFEWVDTPGLNAPNAAHEQTTRQFMSLADVAVWVLSAHQAAKATEVAVLKQLQASHTPVYAVLNKIDQLEPDELPAVHQAVVQALNHTAFDVMDASLKTPARAKQAAHELSLALTSFCEGRIGQLKQRSALLNLRGLVEQAGAQADELRPSLPPASDFQLWNHMTTDLTQPAAVAAFGTALSQALADVAIVFSGSTADAANEEALLHAFLRHLTTALLATRNQLTGLPQPAVQQFDVVAQAFAAQTRGRLEAGLAAKALTGNTVAETRRLLELVLPDVERFLWTPWRKQIQTLVAAEAKRRAQLEDTVAAQRALHDAQFSWPLEALEQRISNAWQALIHEAAWTHSK